MGNGHALGKTTILLMLNIIIYIIHSYIIIEYENDCQTQESP